jgi:hypothetical protein
MTKRDLEILNSLSDRDIVCWLYFSCLKVKIREIARLEALIEELFFIHQLIRKIESQEELFAIIQELLMMTALKVW